jgi:hypothetical protein
MAGIVRPFRRTIEGLGDNTAARVEGQIQGDNFSVTIAGGPPLPVEGEAGDTNFFLATAGAWFTIPALEVGLDQHGSFARLEEQEIALSPRWTVVVEHEYPQPDDIVREPGLEISLRCRPDDETMKTLETHVVIQTGRLPNEVTLLVPDDYGLSIFFNSLGMVDGSAGPGTKSLKKG